ncbi:DUF3040 domain-containing protein [Saccharopolyspora rhizosphaerae]|uniref:DUF3040 domain-containing protein n=1 Tax=Saccharopolyspora rhizosphaerae TaxID=2492662 RepID=A0A426K321_9PSEU|nr:DUF3040 domain-containing protein [Saccharopolyspora rhizosphaerae]RRO19917.1 DUF3040 domain-containing protein [Saccharopolyspora rhizosphaerae]
MLSKHERDRLAEIESALVAADPELAEQFERFQDGHGWSGLRTLLVCTALTLTAMLSLLSLASGLVWTASALGVITAAGALAAGFAARRHGEP